MQPYRGDCVSSGRFMVSRRTKWASYPKELKSDLAHIRGALDKHRKVYKWMFDNGYDDVLTAAEVALALEK